MADNLYDAIVIGSGISGGWAAKELTEKGLKVIMLERGRNIEHIKDYVSATKESWEFPHRGGRTQQMIKDYRAALDEGRHLIDPVISDYQSKFSIDWTPYIGVPYTEKCDTTVSINELQRLLPCRWPFVNMGPSKLSFQ